jgi:hypothetical protein
MQNTHFNINSLIKCGGKIPPSYECCIRPPLIIWRKGMQTQIHFRGNSAYWHSFKWGTIISDESKFQVVRRTKKNVFKMFNGLGINEDLLHYLKRKDIKYIEVPFCGEILKTTTDKWLNEGIRSPYCSERVDRQIIIPLDKLKNDDEQILKNHQLEIFS